MDPFTWKCKCWPADKNLPTTSLYGQKISSRKPADNVR